MLRAFVHRLALSVPLLLGVSALTFVLAALTPGDAAQTILGTQASPEAVAKLNESMGLNLPIYQQYGNWLSGVFHGDLGTSVFTGEPVTRILGDGLPITLTLIVGAVGLSLLIGVPLGVASARRPDRGGQALDVLAMLGFAIPTFWLGLLLVVGFSNTLHLFPASGWVNPNVSYAQWARSLVLPVAALAVGGISLMAKQTRDGMLDAMSREFIRSLRGRGISERDVVYKHALRSALPNTVTLVGLYVVSLLLGTTLVEAVFALRGLGTIAVEATTQHNLPILEGAALYFTLVVVVVFALVDVIRAWLNPKLRLAT
jgi:peptide/nickel transport system permease protein